MLNLSGAQHMKKNKTLIWLWIIGWVETRLVGLRPVEFGYAMLCVICLVLIGKVPLSCVLFKWAMYFKVCFVTSRCATS